MVPETLSGRSEMSKIFHNNTKASLAFPSFLCVDPGTNDKKTMVGITAGILTQIEAGYQTVGIDIVITPSCTFC